MYKKYIYGGISGFCEVCVSHPIDFYKTKIQELNLQKKSLSNNSNFNNFIYNNINNNGIKSIYSGFVPRITGTIPMRTIFWGTQYHINSVCDDYNISSYNKYIITGMGSGLAQSIIDTPIEVMKIKQMTGSNKINIYKLYDGFFFTSSRNMIFSTSVFIGNELSKKYDKLTNFIITGISAFTACIITQPLDFFKTEVQRYKLKNTNINYMYYLNKDNYKLLFSGTIPRASMGFINMGIGAMVFNLLN